MYNFFKGIVEAGKENIDGIWNFIKNPIKSAIEMAQGIAFLKRAATAGTEENIAFMSGIARGIANFAIGDGNEKARIIGKIAGEILITVLATKGMSALKNIIQDSAKAGKLAELIEIGKNRKIGSAEVGSIFEGAAEADVWALKATERGNAIEEALSKTDYKDWYNIGQADNGYFKAIDFQKGNNVVSLKSIDPTLPSYRGNGATNKVLEYLDKLDLPITVDGKLANKVLDVRIPQGTMNNFNMSQLLDEASQRGIKLIIKEFK
ncbi:hypothetical protein [Clostridium omnivorum]|nr:hypothetical protein [Clostridium sp. E14]